LRHIKVNLLDYFLDDNGECIGPERVWLKDEDVPGLAMTRSFGDEVAASVGVLAEPEISESFLSKEDKFLVLASDGIWEFIESEEVIFFQI
jgi:serine/threonine protein phosphatase PrpC